MNAARFASLCLSVLVVITSARSARAEATFEEGIKTRLGKLTKDNLPGLAVLVSRDGKIVYQGGFGFADVEKKTPVTADTKFRIGSITKQFTAAAILKLADDGKLSLTDSLEKYFPGFPRGKEITLHQLLTHTSGLRSYTEKPEFIFRVGKPVTPEKLFEFFRNDPADFAPGAGFHYNNSAYFLAGEIAAKVSGKSFAEYLRVTFFEPLGMKNTGIYVNSAPPPGVARGYKVADGKAGPDVDWDMSWAGGAGALYSTVGDLFLWNEALHDGKLLKEDSRKMMITPVKLPDGVDGWSYGCGLLIARLSRLPLISHSGGLNGWNSDLLWLPDQRCTVVALANALPQAPGFEPATVSRKIAEKILEAEIAKAPPPVEDTKADKKKWPDFTGRYDYQNAVMTVTLEKDRLYAQLTGQEKMEILPFAPNAFFWKVVDAEVEFLRDDKGKVTAARHTQGGTSFKAPRLTEPEVKLTAAELDAILGDYQYGPGIVMTVTRDGDRVYAQLTNQPKMPIFARSAMEYEWRIVKASVKFLKDKDGKVTDAEHTQNGNTFKAPKKK